MDENDTEGLATPEQLASLRELKAQLEMKIAAILAHSAVPDELKKLLNEAPPCK